ncbi:MAG: response regulator transcription factor [Firmicutes bacterium]|nr:response regulator transcription factor [Bacillota bacterium]
MIFCVEDDSSIRELVIYTLKTAEFEAAGFNDGQELFRELDRRAAAGEKVPELILLDIMLPGDDGLTILKKLRADEKTKNIPVIMASAKGTEYDKVSGLDLGADDYLAKPYGMMEMVARVKAVLRRSGETAEETAPVMSGGGIEMDIPKHRVTAEGKEIQLTLKEFDMLEMLLRNKGQVFSRDSLLTEVWGIDFVGETRTVDVHIGTLRTKLGACGKHIKTVRGIGYKFE